VPLKPIKRGYELWCLCDSITGYLFNCRIYLGKEETSGKETLLAEYVVFTLIADHHFEGRHLFFDSFFTSLPLLEKLKLHKISATGIIRPDRTGIPPKFALKEQMERGDYKSLVASNTIIFKWMDTKHVLLAGNGCKDTEIVPIFRQLKNEQLIKINCSKAIKDYNKFIHGVDRFNPRISCYTFDRRSKRNWLQLFVFFFNAFIAISFIFYSQLAQNELSYLNFLVSLTKSICSGAERINLGRPPSNQKRKLASP